MGVSIREEIKKIEIEEKDMCLNVRLICIEARENKNRPDLDPFYVQTILAAPERKQKLSSRRVYYMENNRQICALL